MRVVRFNVWPERAKKRYYYRVYVFDSRKAMEVFWDAHAKKVGIDQRCDFLAVTSSWTTLTIKTVRTRAGKRRWVQDNCIGHMLFYRQRLGAGIVAHECGHAALRFAETILKIPAKALYHKDGQTDASSAEERVLHCLGRMASQFWRAFYKRAPKAWYVR